MKHSEIFRLKWNDFQNNLTGALKRIQSDKDFTDVTLVCGDGQTMEAHKVVLAASSPFLRQVLSSNKHPHPLIFLRAVKLRHLVSVVEFLYKGEVNIDKEDLDSFFSLAADLHLQVLNDIKTSETSMEPSKQLFSAHAEEEIDGRKVFDGAKIRAENKRRKRHKTLDLKWS